MAVEEYALRRGSSGAGTRRGGLGARRVYRILEDDVSFNCYSDRFRIAPWGLFGGRPGEKTRFLVEREGETIALESKVNFPLRKGDRLVIEIAGGGGLRRSAKARERGRGARWDRSPGGECLRLVRCLFIIRTVAKNDSLSWAKEMLKYGAEILAKTEDLTEAIPTGFGGFVARVTF